MSNYKKTVQDLDKAISNHVKTNRSESSMVTGWIVLASVADSEALESDGYIMQSSPGLTHHTSVGLLQVALDDKRNLGLISTMSSLLGDD